jgi:glycosyltransferase involved in cell wall biosynthesis
MTENRAKASVIIPCRNEIKHIGLVIDAILANTYKDIEIIVVDGMSDDGTAEKLEEINKLHPQVKIIDNLRKVTPIAFNLGIKNSTGEFIFIVGARHIIQSNYIETCINVLNEHPEIGCVGGKVNNIYENETSLLISKALSSSFAVGTGNFRILKEDGFVDTVGTPAYRRSIFDEVGFFDEELLRNQDDEFNFRVLKKGYKVFFTVQTSLQYFVRAAFKNLSKQYYQYGFWKVYVNKKHRTVTTLRQLAPLFFVIYLFLGAICSFFSFTILLLYLSGLGLYLLMSILSALKASDNASEFFQIVRTFFIVHYSYGLGYLKGIINFLILGKGLSSDDEIITR